MDDQALPCFDSATADLQTKFANLVQFADQKVVGQTLMARRVVLAMLAKGHVILQGPPGVAKTRMARLLFSSLEGVFNRIQFTPDLLPSDLIGGAVYNSQNQSFEFRKGPLFANYILADEINRAPAKVQSALLEAMEERQISSAEESFQLEPPYFVVATQNPIEHDGTWDLPQAQLDRFMLQINIDYPNAKSEKDILDLLLDEAQQIDGSELSATATISRQELLAAQKSVSTVHISEPVRAYIVRLISSLRADPVPIADVNVHLSHPASSRGSIMLAAATKAMAWLDGREYVVPEDVKELAVCTLSHRVGLTYRAEADGVNSDDVIARLIDHVDVI
ncbi:MAG: AAA family ATPase [Granulosicoccus sp.]